MVFELDYNTVYKYLYFSIDHTHRYREVIPAQVVTSIKQSPVLKGHLFLVPSWEISYELNLFQEVTYLIRPLCLKGGLLIQV